MATPIEFVNYVCEQLEGIGEVRSKKMFGDFLVYVNDKPVVLVCDGTVYVKKLDCIENMMREADVGCPYEGAKDHYILDIEDGEFARSVVSEIEKVTPIPKSRKKKGVA